MKFKFKKNFNNFLFSVQFSTCYFIYLFYIHYFTDINHTLNMLVDDFFTQYYVYEIGIHIF